MNAEQEKLSQELAAKWGERTRKAIVPISELIGEALMERNILAYGFITLAVAGMINYATQIAKALQTGEQGTVAGPEDIPTNGTVH